MEISMWKLLYFAYHVGIWFKYDRFGSHSSWPPLGLPLMVWYTEINSSGHLAISEMLENGHFLWNWSFWEGGLKSKNARKETCQKMWANMWNDMPIQQIDSNFCPHNHQHQKYGSSVQVYSPELMNEWIRTLDHGFNFWEVNVWVKKWEWKLKK